MFSGDTRVSTLFGLGRHLKSDVKKKGKRSAGFGQVQPKAFQKPVLGLEQHIA